MSDSETEDEATENHTENRFNSMQKQLQLDNTLEEFGGFGKLQLAACLVIGYGAGQSTLITNILVSLLTSPELECNGLSLGSCTA